MHLGFFLGIGGQRQGKDVTVRRTLREDGQGKGQHVVLLIEADDAVFLDPIHENRNYFVRLP